MYKRTSVVKNIDVINVSNNSVFEIGDSRFMKPRTKVLAVQREYELFYGDEGNFKYYPIFTDPIPKPVVDESVHVVKYNQTSAIKVNNIDITTLSGSGISHIGSTKTIDAESRIKHIRQLEGRMANNLTNFPLTNVNNNKESL
ncbi:spore germination protein GerPE [Salipaludibacillus daqingensis]|uniref:spore germination protein GerPE n=1 Tax=Salipaludibacillus daqingensis TaxID=3041001 RepID=UPI0024760C72|nr:spore germination protein GerPE [Salipaludibacillus daqingensis]